MIDATEAPKQKSSGQPSDCEVQAGKPVMTRDASKSGREATPSVVSASSRPRGIVPQRAGRPGSPSLESVSTAGIWSFAVRTLRCIRLAARRTAEMWCASKSD